MKVLAVTTTGGTLRSEIIGWTYEDAMLVVDGKPIGYTRGGDGPMHDCVLRAIAAGWRLLGPPQRENEDHVNGDYWEWWLVQE